MARTEPQATTPRDPATIPTVDTAVPSRPSEEFKMVLLDRVEYADYIQRAAAAGYSVESQHHTGDTIFIIFSKPVV